MKRVSLISTVALSLLLGTSALASMPQDQRDHRQDQKQDEKQQKKSDKREQQEDKRGRQDDNAQRRDTRLPQQRQQQLVQEQQQRLTQYREELNRQQSVLQQQSARLQEQKRIAQYRFQQDYLNHLRQQQMFLQNGHPDYDRDPYFYTAPIYRYNRGGRYYEINQYAADLLRQAVNIGYEQGFRAGQADRQDHWGFDYQGSYVYQDANYGYNGYYVDRDDYNYYFREGFRRGYEDGYNSRYQYGRYVNGTYIVIDVILSKILGFESLH